MIQGAAQLAAWRVHVELKLRSKDVDVRDLAAALPGWKRLHTASDKFAPILNKHVLNAFETAKQTIRPHTLMTILPLGHKALEVAMDKAVQVLHRELLTGLEPLLLAGLEAGGNAGAKNLKGLLHRSNVTRTLAADDAQAVMDWVFGRKNEAAVDWAKGHAGELVAQITRTTRDSIRDAISDALDGDLTLEEAADLINDSLGDADRAESIAHHEAMTAVSEGQRQMWDQAVDDGLLSGRERRVWIATEGACPECEDLDGEEADLDGEYPGEGGDGPPMHPRCRCTEGISGLRDAQQYLRDLGGKGSGNWGHAGRKGERGGSGEGGGDGKKELVFGDPDQPAPYVLTRTTERAIDDPKSTKLSKLKTGAVGEAVATSYLKSIGVNDARTLNAVGNNYPVDLVGKNIVYEVKAGLSSNGKSAQQWRATIGQPGKDERAWLKTLPKEQKAEWNARKQQEIMDRKAQAVKEVSQHLGRQVKGKTLTVIINARTKTADLHLFNGFHQRIPWRSDQAREGYIGSFKYK